MFELAKDQFENARNYLLTKARPLERALFNYHFEGVSAEKVLFELAQFQNSDGGFGKALEPDMRSPSSSALATEDGLHTLVELGTPSEHPLVVSAVCYLLNTVDPETKTWRVVPLDVNQHPHAPWWHDQEGSLEKTFDDFKIIPRAGILASLLHYPTLLPQGWLSEVTSATVSDLMEMDVDRFAGGGDSVVYTRRLAEAPGLPEKTREVLVKRVRWLADQVVTRDPAAWSQYSALPIKLAPTPESITTPPLSDCIPAHLDVLVETQTPEGYWDVTWAWSDYAEEWEIAKKEWRGILALGNLLALKAYGRISA